jgi:hypothetical protein
MRSRSRERSTVSARCSSRLSSSAVSPAWTRPRWRSGSARLSSRGERAEDRQAGPRHAVLDEPPVALARDPIEHHARDPDAGIVGRAAERHRGRGLGVARHVEDEEHGPAEQGATSAFAPVRPGSPRMPSKSPMDPSAITRSASLSARARIAARSGGGIAKLSRLKLGAPVAAAWKAGSM